MKEREVENQGKLLTLILSVRYLVKKGIVQHMSIGVLQTDIKIEFSNAITPDMILNEGDLILFRRDSFKTKTGIALGDEIELFIPLSLKTLKGMNKKELKKGWYLKRIPEFEKEVAEPVRVIWEKYF